MANRTTRMILAVALAAPIATLAQTNGLPRPAYVVSNAYVEIRSSQPLWRNGGLDFRAVTNAAPPLDMVVTPMPGWELLTPSELHITDGHAGMWSVRGVLGETGAGGEMCIPMTTSNDTHMVAPSFRLPPISTGAGGSGPSAESLPPISSGGPYVVASTSDTAMVSFSCAPTDLTNGVHECHTSFFSCPGGKTNKERKGPAREYQTLFDRFTWVWSCGGTTNTQEGLALRAGPLELHAGVHPVSATLTARYSNCDKCVYTETVETNIVVSLLTVTCDPWIGLDRTGDPATPYESSNVTARASLSPENPDVDKVEWDYDGVCDKLDKRDWEMDVWTTSREMCSEHYRDEEVSATAGGASVSTNFTVVKVDVEINGLDEAAEESAGAYLAYVADTNGVMTVAGTNAMVGVKFTCTPDNLPSDEMVTIENKGHGELYMKEGEALYLVTSTNIPACQIGGKTFLLHGHTPSEELQDGEITIEHPSSKAKDRAFYTVVKINIDGEYMRDGIPMDHENESEKVCFTEDYGMVITVNEDDDDANRHPDNADTKVNGVADMGDIHIIRLSKLGPIIADIPSEVEVELRVEFPPDETRSFAPQNCMRIFDSCSSDAHSVIGPDSLSNKVIFKKAPGPHDLDIRLLSGSGSYEMGVEGIEHGKKLVIKLFVCIGGKAIGSDSIQLLVAPFIVLSNLETATKVYVADSSAWGNFADRMMESINGFVPAVKYDADFTQDFAEIGASKIKGAHDGVSHCTIAGFLGERYANEISSNTGYFQLHAGNVGGNIEASPPFPGHPFGRIIVGDNLLSSVKRFLTSQLVQTDSGKAIELPVDWLRVKHVDEVMTIVPAQDGFRVLVADLDSAIVKLRHSSQDDMDISAPILAEYDKPTNANTIANINRELGEIRRRLASGLGISEAEIIKVPVPFRVDRAGGPRDTYLPNMINMLVVKNAEGMRKLIIPHPIVMSLVDAMEEILINIGYDNGEAALVVTNEDGGPHVDGGEVHCASNVRRELR